MTRSAELLTVLDDMEVALNQMRQVLDSVLDIERVDNVGLSLPSVTWVSVDEWLWPVMSVMGMMSKRMGKELELHSQLSNDVLIKLDRRLVAQAVGNLLSNAISVSVTQGD